MHPSHFNIIEAALKSSFLINKMFSLVSRAEVTFSIAIENGLK